MIALPRPATTKKEDGPLECSAGGADPLYFCMEWNAENELKRVLKNSVEQARFAYDPNGRRVEKVAGGVTTSWAYDGEDLLREVAGATAVKYVHGPGIDAPLASDDGSALSYFHVDGLGSIVKTTSSAGAVTLTRQYDTWGSLQAGSTTGGYSYTGREWDPETGLYYYRARYYDPKALSEDPVEIAARPLADQNGYAYVGNDPVDRVDPTGGGFLDCPKIIAELIAAGAKLIERIAQQAAGSKDPAVVAGMRRQLSNSKGV